MLPSFILMGVLCLNVPYLLKPQKHNICTATQWNLSRRGRANRATGSFTPHNSRRILSGTKTLFFPVKVESPKRTTIVRLTGKHGRSGNGWITRHPLTLECGSNTMYYLIQTNRQLLAFNTIAQRDAFMAEKPGAKMLPADDARKLVQSGTTRTVIGTCGAYSVTDIKGAA